MFDNSHVYYVAVKAWVFSIRIHSCVLWHLSIPSASSASFCDVWKTGTWPVALTNMVYTTLMNHIQKFIEDRVNARTF